MGEKTLKKNKGFTLIEILIVISIIGLVMIVGVSSYGIVRRRVNLDVTTNEALSLLTEARDKAKVGYFESDGSSICFGFKLERDGYIQIFETKYDRLKQDKKCSRLNQDIRFLRQDRTEEAMISIKNIEKFDEEVDELYVFFRPPYSKVEIDNMNISSAIEPVISFILGYKDSDIVVDNREIIFNVITGNAYKKK